MSFSSLIAGCILAVLAPIAGAQTLADVQELMKQKKMPQALQQAERYIEARPEDAQGPFTKGLILTEMGRLKEATALFADLTERFPELPEPYNNLAVLYARQKQYDKAQAALEMAIRTHPSYAIAHENLGDIYAKLASLAYDKALQLDSSNRSMQTKLSMIKELVSTPARPAAPAARVPEMAAAKPVPAVPPMPVQPPAPPPVSTPVSPAPTPTPTPTPVAVAPKAVVVSPPPPPPPPAAPAAKPDKAKAAANIGPEITGIVRDWAAAWSRKDVAAYLAFYASDFQTPKGIARRKWETERRQRIDKPGTLRVSVSDIKVSVSDGRATARFNQNYVSSALKSQTQKALVFVKTGDRWLILIERVN